MWQVSIKTNNISPGEGWGVLHPLCSLSFLCVNYLNSGYLGHRLHSGPISAGRGRGDVFSSFISFTDEGGEAQTDPKPHKRKTVQESCSYRRGWSRLCPCGWSGPLLCGLACGRLRWPQGGRSSLEEHAYSSTMIQATQSV